MNDEEHASREEGTRAGNPSTPDENRLEAERQLNALLTTLLTGEAKTRLTNVRMVNSEKYLQVAQMLLSMYKQGRIQGKITDEQLKQLLTQLSTSKKNITITRK